MYQLISNHHCDIAAGLCPHFKSEVPLSVVVTISNPQNPLCLLLVLFPAGGMNMDVFDGCMVAEELAFGCTGIMTAMEASGLGVSGACALLGLYIHE